MWKATIHMKRGIVEVYGDPNFVLKACTYWEAQPGWLKTTSSQA